MRVEFLYFDGCPSYQRLLPRLHSLIDELAPEAELVLRKVESVEDAKRERFLGSPTVRVDGMDVDPGAGRRTDFGLGCRLYGEGPETVPLPPEAWIRAALASSGRAAS